jgi:hypothetical protein
VRFFAPKCGALTRTLLLISPWIGGYRWGDSEFFVAEFKHPIPTFPIRGRQFIKSLLGEKRIAKRNEVEF